MPPEDPAAESALDKPLHWLTDDDMSQLTREDCRRYLKQKGMRRPSWNKSQAMQQVISLKKLLETTPADTEIKKPCSDPRRVQRNASAKDPCCSGDLPSHVVAGENESARPRAMVSPVIPVGQMAIFYCGKVNVYDDVPANKAQAVMLLAASPLHLPEGASCDGHVGMQPSSCRLLGAGFRGGIESAAVPLPAPQPVRTIENPHLYDEASNCVNEDNHAFEGQAGRKASVQRYLEKREGRFKSKRKVGITSSGSLDICLNHQMASQTLNEHTSRSNPCSPPKIRPPNTPTRCNSAENNAAENVSPSAGINSKVLAFPDVNE